MGWIGRPARFLSLAALAAAGLTLSGCGKDLPMTPFDPHGPVAASQLKLLSLSLYMAIGIGTVVSLLLIFVVLRFRQVPGKVLKAVPPQVHGSTKLEIAWTLIPVLILVAVGVPTVQAAFRINQPQEPVALTVKATGSQWWFAFEYPDQQVVTANELHIPVGKPVKVLLASRDVIHSFWIPKLAGKTDMIPNRANTMWIQADEPGEYYGQCAELCGTSHANMRFRVIAEPQEQFDAWIRDRQAGAKQPTDPMAVTGKALFEGSGKAACWSCHTIDGSAKAKGTVGPNLSNIGARGIVAAGVLENTDENLKKWIRDPKSVKPGVIMPSHPQSVLSDEELDAVVAYLRSLK